MSLARGDENLNVGVAIASPTARVDDFHRLKQARHFRFKLAVQGAQTFFEGNVDAW